MKGPGYFCVYSKAEAFILPEVIHHLSTLTLFSLLLSKKKYKLVICLFQINGQTWPTFH